MTNINVTSLYGITDVGTRYSCAFTSTLIGLPGTMTASGHPAHMVLVKSATQELYRRSKSTLPVSPLCPDTAGKSY